MAHRVPHGKWATSFILTVLWANSTLAADRQEAEKLLRTGQYDACAQYVGEALEAGAIGEAWWHLKVKAEAARGHYADAFETLAAAQGRYRSSIPLQLLAYEVHRRGGQATESAVALGAIETLIRNGVPRAPLPEVRIALGRYFLLRGADARQVLDEFYNAALKQDPNHIDAYYALAELALAKQDYALMAETLYKAPETAAEDPRYHYLLARAFAESDWAETSTALDAALAINPNHVDSLLLQVDRLINREEYEEADTLIDQVLTVDALEPRAWAYRAVIAHLRADPEGEFTAHEKALERWPSNPEVDHQIGRKLSQDYRFAEGSEYQRKSLAMYPDYLPAKVQLCQDLLRLGEEDEGWALAEEIFTKDAYNVVAYNLVTLRDNLSKYATVEGEGFVIRMDPLEAELYGERALALLQEAREVLCAKYDVQIPGVIIVEIFPRQQDFAVRTFGLPGAEGFLGVCFGRVITANSPASQGETPSSWEAVLWHEFCHTVTLHKTHNKMPRWLSEGISVYEEEQKSHAWGDWLKPAYREMALGEDLTPLSDLSSAFLSPKSAAHIRFAYYESALAVEFLVTRFGFDALKEVLDDLGAGLPINEALVRRTAPLEVLDQEFADFARVRAKSVAPEATWEELEFEAEPGVEELRAWLEKHPKHFPAHQLLATQLILAEQWEEAETVLNDMRALYPEFVASGNAYELLAVVYRNTDRADEERAILEELAALHSDMTPAFTRLIELAEAEEDWSAMARNARRLLGVNPLIPAPHRALAKAAEMTGEPQEALAAYSALLKLGDPDIVTIHYRRALLLRGAGQLTEARREVLMALEEAPRFLEAHRLLLELAEDKP